MFSSVLFSFHRLVIFFHLFLCSWFLVSYHYIRKDTWYDFKLTKFTETCFVSHCMVCPWMFHTYLGICILLHLDRMFCINLLCQPGLMFYLRPLLTCWFSVWIIYPLIEVVSKVPTFIVLLSIFSLLLIIALYILMFLC